MTDAPYSVLNLFPSASAGRFGRRRRRERGARIPVSVITGFLGAGKTTLVRAFLNSEQGRGTAVLVNEFGEAGIDDALLRDSAEATALLGNGCLCCNYRSDLQAALHGLVIERERGKIPYFGRVIIETSGLADPGPILTTFATDRALGGEFHIETVMAVVAAVSADSTLDRFIEARRQILLADRVVLAKTDIADADQIARAQARVRALNPRAEILTAVNGALDPRGFFEPSAPALVRTAISGAGGGFFAEEVEIEHTDNVRSFTLVEHAPLAFEPFARAMEALMALRGADLLRVKGWLNVAGCAGPVIVHFVQHLAHPPIELDRWPGTDRASRVVFIMRGIGERQVRDLLAATRALHE
ncbi:MAG: GTP-binding protein [Proteobacteria bacterium]|nr:GTP-binding protein [Pseudomonadota bacterium]